MNKMITRTIKTMDVKVKYANLGTNTIEEMLVTIPYVKTASQVDKKAAEAIPAEYKMLSAELVAEKETIYGMDEMEFLRMAKPVIRGNNGTARPLTTAAEPQGKSEGGDSDVPQETEDNAGSSEGTQVPPETVDDTASKIAAKKARKQKA